VDAEEQMLMPRDVLLLCSDGLTRMVTEPEIAGTLQSEMDPTKASEKLIALANERRWRGQHHCRYCAPRSDSKGWFSCCAAGRRKKQAEMVPLEGIEMPKLSLMSKINRARVAVGSRP